MDIYITLATALVDILLAVEDLHFSDKGLSALRSFWAGLTEAHRQAEEHQCPQMYLRTHEPTVTLERDISHE